MRGPLAACLALSLSATAAFAGTVYIPVPDPVGSGGSSHVIQVWVTNSGTAQRPYAATYLEAESDGTKRSSKPTEVPVAAGRTSIMGGIGFRGRVGMLEVDTNSAMSIEARLVSTSANGQSSYSTVPAISSRNLFEAGETALLQGLGRGNGIGDVTSLGIVNLGKQASRCEIKVFRADGSQVATTASLTFNPLSLRHFADTFGLLGQTQVTDARVQVSCDQLFYAYATVFIQTNSQMIFVTPSASGASTLTGPGGDNQPPPSSSGAVVYTRPGLFHTATTGLPKGAFDIALDRDMSLKRLVIDMDFIPGPWNLSKSPNNHGLLWLYRGRFRGDTIANVNAFGPSKLTLKAAQNINLGPQQSTQNETGVAWRLGEKYHLRYTYDAENSTVSVVLSLAGATVKSFNFPTTSPNGILSVPAHGMKVEFGHYPGQEGPEVPSYGWRYSDLRIEMVPY
jgi:hypothetical protein